jgi:hypothetical protein
MYIIIIYRLFQVFTMGLGGNRPIPVLITMLFVAGLAHPDFLAEMDAIAVVPE